MAAVLYREGLEAYRTGSYETAVIQFTAALERGPKEAARIHDARSAAYEKLGRIRSALEDARAVVTLLPNSHKGYLRGGRLCRLAEKWERGEAMLEKASKQTDVNEKVLLEIQGELDTLRKLKTKATFSSISTLPLDLFVHIIALAITPSGVPHHRLPQLTLLRSSRVCKSWSTAISDAPRLWNALVVKRVTNEEHNLEGLRTWSMRSKGRDGMGLGLRSIAIDNASRAFIERMSRVLERDGSCSQLEEYSQNLYPRHDPRTPCPSYALLRRIASPSIRNMSISIAGMWATTTDQLNWTDFLSLPTISRYSLEFESGLHGMYSSDFKAEEPLVESTVVHLKLHRVPNRLILAFDFPRVKSFKYISANEGRDPAIPLIPLLGRFALRKLEELTLDGCNSFQHSPLSNVSFDSMISLTLNKSSTLASALFDSISSVQLPFPVLTHLNLDRTRLNPQHLRLVGSDNAPHLTSLHLAGTTFTSFTPDDFPIFASLETLDLSKTSWPTNQLVEDLCTKTPAIIRLSLMGCGRSETALTGFPIVNLVKSRRLIPSPPIAPAPPSWICNTSSFLSPAPPPAPTAPSTKFETAMQELNLKSLRGLETGVVDWLRANTRKGTVSFQFYDRETQ